VMKVGDYRDVYVSSNAYSGSVMVSGAWWVMWSPIEPVRKETRMQIPHRRQLEEAVNAELPAYIVPCKTYGVFVQHRE
jgi:hypothetical protein